MVRFVDLSCSHERHGPTWVDGDAVVAVTAPDLGTEVHFHGGAIVRTELTVDEVLRRLDPETAAEVALLEPDSKMMGPHTIG